MSDNYINIHKEWECVIGLEVHAQVVSFSKLFSSASTNFGADPNSQVSLVDMAFPGMLPVLNEFCIKQAVKTGIALNSHINLYSAFDRKNYFYPDLPQGYQISQFFHPIVQKGWIDIKIENFIKKIRINRIHLEQDAGKSIHDQAPNYTFIDLNRSGIALMEIVTEPDMRSSIEAGEFIKKLRAILRYVGTCNGNMEKGNLRCDANVSVRKIGEELGTRCEIKNLNSIKNIIKAIEYETQRQINILKTGNKIIQETRLFDLDKGITRTMRSKEDAYDYRYFPDPDLLPIKLDLDYIDQIRKEMPELPDAKIERYISQYKLTPYDAQVLVAEKESAYYFESVASKVNDAKLVANWMISELFGLLNKHNCNLTQCLIPPENLIELLLLIENEIISGKIAKTIIEQMFLTGNNAKEIIKEQNLSQISNSDEITNIIFQVIQEYANIVNEYKSGKEKSFDFLMGQIMKKTKGKVNPNIANKLLKEKLNNI